MATDTQQPTMGQGLMDWFKTPDAMALAMGLMNAGGYSTTPTTMGQGLAAGFQNMQTQQDQRLNAEYKRMQMDNMKQDMELKKKRVEAQQQLAGLMGNPSQGAQGKPIMGAPLALGEPISYGTGLADFGTGIAAPMGEGNEVDNFQPGTGILGGMPANEIKAKMFPILMGMGETDKALSLMNMGDEADWSEPKASQGPDGRIVWMQYNKKNGQTRELPGNFAPPPKALGSSNLSVEDQNGVQYDFTLGGGGEAPTTNSVQGGGAMPATGGMAAPAQGGLPGLGGSMGPSVTGGPGTIRQTPTKATSNDLQKRISDALQSQMRLDQIAENYSKEYLTYKGQAKAGMGHFATKLMGMPVDAEYRKGYTTFKNSVLQNFNMYRKEITGAAASVQELDRLMQSMLNTDMDEVEFSAAYKQFRDLNTRGLKIAQELSAKGVPVGKIGRMVDDQLMQEGAFGGGGQNAGGGQDAGGGQPAATFNYTRAGGLQGA